jgi:hypothetical protein
VEASTCDNLKSLHSSNVPSAAKVIYDQTQAILYATYGSCRCHSFLLKKAYTWFYHTPSAKTMIGGGIYLCLHFIYKKTLLYSKRIKKAITITVTIG